MNRRARFPFRLPPRIASRLALFTALVALCAGSLLQRASGYSLNGKSWPNGTVVLQLGLGPSAVLSDGSASWNAAVAPVLSMWNAQIGRIQLTGVMDAALTAGKSDRINSVVFSTSVFGQAFGNGTLAVTYYMTQGTDMIEADVLFNRAQVFDSYRGNLRFGSNGYAIADIRRVFLHELGHGLGLNHQEGDNIMAAMISDRETLSSDDIAGARAMYGAPVATPTPPPLSTPTPAPTVPPGNGDGRLGNISTRMKVGVNEEVSIVGFIMSGTQPKKVLLRVRGPSLAAFGVNSPLQDPTLELLNASGASMAQSDDWQVGGQSAAISGTGLAPSDPAEAALIATLSPGTYTAIVRGRNGTQGVAVVEAYELDTPTTRFSNLSTRGRVGAGDQVMIGGLIVQGTSGKKVLIRAVGSSLVGLLTSPLGDPNLEIYNSAGQLIASNDNWNVSAQAAEIVSSTLAPKSALESAVIINLSPGTYTAIVKGTNNSVGVGLVEVFDLDP
jgi:hypothetical protein